MKVCALCGSSRGPLVASNVPGQWIHPGGDCVSADPDPDPDEDEDDE